MELSIEEKQLLEGAIRAIDLEMEMGETPTYFDSDVPDYDNDADWEVAEGGWENRNGVKIQKILRRIIDGATTR